VCAEENLMKLKLPLLPAALLLASQPLFAADAALDAVIVTASRTARTADETLAPVTVVTSADIERLQAQSLPELFNGLPGLSVANNGGMGKATGVFLRGAEAGHVLVLIDGVKAGSATLGTTSFEQLPVGEIERIEIVRGPRSSLYGSEAIGGVIQIFTRKGGGAFTPHFSVGAGSDRTGQFSGGFTGGGADKWVSVNLSGIDTQGFNACNGTFSAGCYTVEPDNDGYRNLAGSARAGMRLDGGTEVDVRWLRSNSTTQFDGDFVNESKSAQQVLGGSLRLSPLAAWRVTLLAGRSVDESDGYKDGAWMSRFDTQRDTFSWQNDLALDAKQLVTLGFDYQDDSIASDTAYTVARRDNRGLFAQYQGDFGAHSVQFSARGDDNQQFGKHGTGGVSWGMRIGETLLLTAAYGTAFKAPIFNDLYYPGYGSPDLKPESSRSAELGLRGSGGAANWSLNAYETRVDDLIAYDAARYAPGNVSSALIRGLEGSLGMRLADWQVNAHVTLLNPENRSSGAHSGKNLARRPEQTLRLDLDRDLGKVRVGATLLAVGESYDDLANQRRLGGYATLDLRADYKLTKDWLVQAKAANLFDRDYETAAFYNQPGRSLFVTLRYQPAQPEKR
jgi:vitamin B12 transporter